MVDRDYINAGKRLKFVRELLLLTVGEVFELSEIKETTLRRIESGTKSAFKDRVNTLCYLYQIEVGVIFDIKAPLPSWQVLRRKVLERHRDNDFLLKSMEKQPYPKKAIKYRVAQSIFLNRYKSPKDLVDHLRKRYNWVYDYDAIFMALNSLVDDGYLEESEDKTIPTKFRLARGKNQHISSITSLIIIKLEEIIPKETTDSVTPAYRRMAEMLISLQESGAISRSKLYKNVRYGNHYKNHQKSLKILLDVNLVEQTEERSTSSNQKHRLTKRGKRILEELMSNV